MAEGNTSPSSDRSTWRALNYAADDVVKEARFAVSALAAERARNTGEQPGVNDRWRVDAESRASNAVQAVASRSDTQKVLADAGLTLQTARADIANGRFERLTEAFKETPLGMSRSYGPSASPSATTAADYWRVSAQLRSGSESPIAGAREDRSATRSAGPTGTHRPGPPSASQADNPGVALPRWGSKVPGSPVTPFERVRDFVETLPERLGNWAELRPNKMEDMTRATYIWAREKEVAEKTGGIYVPRRWETLMEDAAQWRRNDRRGVDTVLSGPAWTAKPGMEASVGKAQSVAAARAEKTMSAQDYWKNTAAASTSSPVASSSEKRSSGLRV